MAILTIPFALMPKGKPDDQTHPEPSCTYYEGVVTHVRRAPKENKFKYHVRPAVVGLDKPPAWFLQQQASDHMDADAARQYAGTDGKVLLLTSPVTAGYVQNPISVYYCYSTDGTLSRCIAEVTNTPWNERVKFVFDPAGSSVKKSLHVSPFMDMQGTWLLEASEPADTLRLVVKVKHPEYGNFFHADLTAVKSQLPGTGNEEGGWNMLVKYGFQSHRVAVLIYWQALILIWKGLPLHGLPSQEVKESAVKGATHIPNAIDGKFFSWRPAPRWPWNAQLVGSVCPALGMGLVDGSCPSLQNNKGA